METPAYECYRCHKAITDKAVEVPHGRRYRGAMKWSGNLYHIKCVPPNRIGLAASAWQVAPAQSDAQESGRSLSNASTGLLLPIDPQWTSR